MLKKLLLVIILTWCILVLPEQQAIGQPCVNYLFELLTDEWPEETTWTLSQNGNTLYSGGPYAGETTLYTDSFCLTPGNCYDFTILDDGDDGICCDWGTGWYRISDPIGMTVVSGGQFESVDMQNFCVEGADSCFFSANVVVVPASGDSAMDGSIQIIPTTGTPPYDFSIDNGQNIASNGFFNGLNSGQYDILVTDAEGCMFDTSLTVPVSPAGISATQKTTPVVYPNPAADVVYVHYEPIDLSESRLTLEVLDMVGRSIIRRELTRNDHLYSGVVNLEGVPEGVYFIRVIHPSAPSAVRIVLQSWND